MEDISRGHCGVFSELCFESCLCIRVHKRNEGTLDEGGGTKGDQGRHTTGRASFSTQLKQGSEAGHIPRIPSLGHQLWQMANRPATDHKNSTSEILVKLHINRTLKWMWVGDAGQNGTPLILRGFFFVEEMAGKLVCDYGWQGVDFPQ